MYMQEDTHTKSNIIWTQFSNYSMAPQKAFSRSRASWKCSSVLARLFLGLGWWGRGSWPKKLPKSRGSLELPRRRPSFCVSVSYVKLCSRGQLEVVFPEKFGETADVGRHFSPRCGDWNEFAEVNEIFRYYQLHFFFFFLSFIAYIAKKMLLK